MIDDELAESVTLKNGVVIEIHTGSISSPRGRTFIAVLADEIAFWRSEDSANPDADVIAAVRPGLASIPDSILLMASSPYAKRGVLFTMFRRHFGKDGARVLVWRGTTAEMNPTLDSDIIAEAYGMIRRVLLLNTAPSSARTFRILCRARWWTHARFAVALNCSRCRACPMWHLWIRAVAVLTA